MSIQSVIILSIAGVLIIWALSEEEFTKKELYRDMLERLFRE